MNQLKTLKELEDDFWKDDKSPRMDNRVPTETLRKEAIKWFKELELLPKGESYCLSQGCLVYDKGWNISINVMPIEIPALLLLIEKVFGNMKNKYLKEYLKGYKTQEYKEKIETRYIG